MMALVYTDFIDFIYGFYNTVLEMTGMKRELLKIILKRQMNFLDI